MSALLGYVHLVVAFVVYAGLVAFARVGLELTGHIAFALTVMVASLVAYVTSKWAVYGTAERLGLWGGEA